MIPLLLGLAWAALVAVLAGSWTLVATVPIVLVFVGRACRGRVSIGRGPRSFPTMLRRRILARDGGRCRYCGFDVHYEADCPATPLGCPECFQADHVLAWANGGSTVEANGVTSCRACNLQKGAMPVEDYVTWLWSTEGMAWLEKRRARVGAR